MQYKHYCFSLEQVSNLDCWTDLMLIGVNRRNEYKMYFQTTIQN